MSARALLLVSLASLLFALGGCPPPRGFGPDAGRDAAPAPDARAWSDCTPPATRCFSEIFQRCVPAGEFSTVEEDDCVARGEVCLPMQGCLPCRPGSHRCSRDETTVQQCREDGSGWEPVETCDVAGGVICRGERCRALCDDPDAIGTNIGCEYYAVDLDNAQLGPGESAASQQYAVVVSNPSDRHTARVQIEWNTAPPGMPPRPAVIATAVVPPMDLEVFPLPAREVDCSMPGTFNTGTHTCLSSQAYRIRSTAPVIAFQFNPLENVQVFSNDASLLIPTNSLGSEYTVMSWPQTLASGPPQIVLNPSNPADLRGFLTVVGVSESTRVRVVPRADVHPGGPLEARSPAGTPIEVTLGPFDVLNLETDGFLADFTGSLVSADRPVAVFSGSECSDVPAWRDLNDRRCCCDHLEAQQFPRETLGRHYFAVHTPRRTPVVRAAGAMVAQVENEPEFFRVMAAMPGVTHVRTTLPSVLDDVASPPLEFDLMQGEVRTLRAYRHFEVTASAPVSVANFMSSQLNTGIPLNYPGGDGSFVPMPPSEQWRQQYVFLTPDKYAFDFVMIVAPVGVRPFLDDDELPTTDCEVERADGCVETRTHTCPPAEYLVYSCQLSYPLIDPDLPYPLNVRPGRQRDGVHVVRASEPVGVIVSGFDLRVSYGYPAGTQLRPLN